MVAPAAKRPPADPPARTPLPADLARVVAAWADLPPAVRAGVLAMAEAATGG